MRVADDYTATNGASENRCPDAILARGEARAIRQVVVERGAHSDRLPQSLRARPVGGSRTAAPLARAANQPVSPTATAAAMAASCVIVIWMRAMPFARAISAVRPCNNTCGAAP